MFVSSYIISWVDLDAGAPAVRTRWTVEEAYEMAFSCIDTGMVSVSLTTPSGEVYDHELLASLRPR